MKVRVIDETNFSTGGVVHYARNRAEALSMMEGIADEIISRKAVSTVDKEFAYLGLVNWKLVYTRGFAIISMEL